MHFTQVDKDEGQIHRHSTNTPSALCFIKLEDHEEIPQRTERPQTWDCFQPFSRGRELVENL